MGLIEQLDRTSVSWANFDEAGRVTRDIVQELGADKATLRNMVLRLRGDEHLRELCQLQGELVYIVIYEALDRGIRIRLHRLSARGADRPHTHRFSFSTVIMKGSYAHTIYGAPEMAGAKASSWRLRQAAGTYEDKVLEEFPFAEIVPLWSQQQETGSSYSLHHSAIHASQRADEAAYSLFLRGPAEKDRALIMNQDELTYYWKFGRENESAAYLQTSTMSVEVVNEFIEELQQNEII